MYHVHANCGSAASQTFSYDPFGNTSIPSIPSGGSPYSFVVGGLPFGFFFCKGGPLCVFLLRQPALLTLLALSREGRREGSLLLLISNL